MLIDNLKDAMEIFGRQKLSASYTTRFRNKVKKHFERDYSNARGLVTLGMGGCKTKPFIEVDFDTSKDKFDFDLMVAVFHNKEWIVFARSEALGYDEFVVQPDEYARRVEQVKARSIEEKRKSNAVPDR